MVSTLWTAPRWVIPVLLLYGWGGATVAQQPKVMTGADYGALVAPPPDARLAYGDGELQFGELRLPSGKGPHPVAIILHGGCWLSQYGLEPIGKLAAALTEEGLATWSVEYRRVGDPGGGWPGTFEDVARAADHLRSLAREYPLDLGRVIAVGHSAGGHLALWLAARDRLPEGPFRSQDPIAIHGVLGLAPAADLAFLYEQEVCGHVVRGLMGGSPEEFPDRYRIGSAVELIPIDSPQILILGRHDSAWSPVGRRYYDAAREESDLVRLVEAPESGHFEMVDPDSTTWPLVRKAALDLAGT